MRRSLLIVLSLVAVMATACGKKDGAGGAPGAGAGGPPGGGMPPLPVETLSQLDPVLVLSCHW